MKHTYGKLMIALLVGAIMTGILFFGQVYRFAEIVYAEDAGLEDELYCDSLELIAICVQAEAGNQSLRRKVGDHYFSTK